MSPKPVRDVIVATSIFVHKYTVSMYFSVPKMIDLTTTSLMIILSLNDHH